MSSTLSNLEPRLLWASFDAIRNIPRPSGHERAVVDHLRAWADDHGFATRADAAGNLVIAVPATPGHEAAPIVVLQGHVDMVCEKNAGVTHDFLTQGIEVEVDGDWVRARGTTLGADNGIGVAASLAAAVDPAVVHGPLELLLTVSEEVGLVGAKGLDSGLVSGRLLLNLDTEEDGAVYIGCAGGAGLEARLALARCPAALTSLPHRLAVSGLAGGHSGLNIVENRGNAVRLAARILGAARDAGVTLALVAVDGGSKHNAIPRECFVDLRLGADQSAALTRVVERCLADFRTQYAATDPDLAVTLAARDPGTAEEVMEDTYRDRLLWLLEAMPNGVHAMSREVPGLVETSSNLAVVSTGADAVRIVSSHRSSVMPALLAARDHAVAVCRLAGCTVALGEPYAGWKPDPDSRLVQRTIAVHARALGATPAVKAIHAGLECGLLIDKLPGLDAVSFGPQIEGAHSPDERVQISSVARSYRLLTALLADLA